MDMLIKLYPAGEPSGRTVPASMTVRRPLAPEHDAVVDWVAAHFSAGWASEARAALADRPSSLYVAIRQGSIVGFCCYDATARGFVGPIGVLPDMRGSGVGAALLRACLADMRTIGYAYAVAGYVGEPEFFRRAAGAIEIPDSTPGIYAGMLGP